MREADTATIDAASRADRSFRSWLESYDLMERIDARRFYPTNRHAAAFRRDLERGLAREAWSCHAPFLEINR